jgi:UDP-N-acetylmuramate dehydrogenase
MSGRGLSGLEFAGGIPASMGGAARMNAGAHGGQISDVLESLTFVDVHGNVREVTPAELNFSYRRSGLPDGAIVTSVRLVLKPSEPEECIQRRNHFLSERKKAQPLSSPSAGSVFKNPAPDRTAGKLIESVALKGERRGGAMISEKHGNWIINVERRAVSGDVLELIELCKERVFSETGLRLEQEVIYWGEGR